MRSELINIIERLKVTVRRLEMQGEQNKINAAEIEAIARLELVPIADYLKDLAYENRSAKVKP